MLEFLEAGGGDPDSEEGGGEADGDAPDGRSGAGFAVGLLGVEVGKVAGLLCLSWVDVVGWEGLVVFHRGELVRCVGLDVGEGDVELDGEPEREVDQTCKGRGGVAGEVGLEPFMESLLVWLLADADVDNRPRG